MRASFKAIFFLILMSFNDLNAQCPPTNSTATITGLYSADLNPTSGSIIYVAPSGTITGNINLNNSSLYNCGTILSKKITMRQSSINNQFILENNNIIKCDSVSLDSLGHIHNNDTLLCELLKLSNNSNADNSYFIDANSILVESESNLNSQSAIKVNYFDMKDNNSSFYNSYSTISARKLFRIGSGTVMSGIIFICADSCFINNGTINNQAMQTWTPTIRVNNLSANTGTIYGIDFCDLSTTNGGMPDVNTGTLMNVTFCTAQQNYCDYSFTSIQESGIKTKAILIFPNPASDLLYVSTDLNDFENAEMEIINSLGQVVLRSQFKTEINVSDLAKGCYILKISNSEQQFHSKFVKD